MAMALFMPKSRLKYLVNGNKILNKNKGWCRCSQINSSQGSSFLSIQFQLKFERKYVRVGQAFKCCFYDRPVIEVSEMQTVNPQIASYPSGQNC